MQYVSIQCGRFIEVQYVHSSKTDFRHMKMYVNRSEVDMTDHQLTVTSGGQHGRPQSRSQALLQPLITAFTHTDTSHR